MRGENVTEERIKMPKLEESIYHTLAIVQQELPDIGRDGTNDAYGSKYITLSGLLRAVRPTLIKHDLILVTRLKPATVGLNVSVTLRSLATGQEIESSLDSSPGLANDQKIGTSITYLTRYLTASLLGITIDEDDDGNLSAGVKAKTRFIEAPPAPKPAVDFVKPVDLKPVPAFVEKAVELFEPASVKVVKKGVKTLPAPIIQMSTDDLCGFIQQFETMPDISAAAKLWLTHAELKHDKIRRKTIYEVFKSTYKSLVASGKIDRGTPIAAAVKTFENKMKAEGEDIAASEELKGTFDENLFNKNVQVGV